MTVSASKFPANKSLDFLRRHPELETCTSRFGKCEAWRVDGHEIAHTHLDGHVDLRLGKALIREHLAMLDAHPAVTLREKSDWMEIDPADPKALKLLKELLPLIMASER